MSLQSGLELHRCHVKRFSARAINGPATIAQYVVGFAFALSADSLRHVLLIEKQRPNWQRGLYNGVGGKIEAAETATQAMAREFKKETGLAWEAWDPVAVLRGADFSVAFFSAFMLRGTFWQARSTTDEMLVRVRTDRLHGLPMVPNLHVLIPLALDDSGIRKPVLLVDEISRETRL